MAGCPSESCAGRLKGRQSLRPHLPGSARIVQGAMNCAPTDRWFHAAENSGGCSRRWIALTPAAPQAYDQPDVRRGIAPMSELLAGNTSDFDEERRRIVSVNGRDIVVFRHKDRFFALDNTCLHQGGPVGEG